MIMSSFLCFICHSTVNSDTNEETREKYREVVGMHLCPDSHLCYICCHVLNKLWLFKSVCLKRSLEYPVLFSEKGTLNLQRNEIEYQSFCHEDNCSQYYHRNINSKTYHLHFDTSNFPHNANNEYVELEDDRPDFDDYFNDDRMRQHPVTGQDKLKCLHSVELERHTCNQYHEEERQVDNEQFSNKVDSNKTNRQYNVGTQTDIEIQEYLKKETEAKLVDDDDDDYGSEAENIEMDSVVDDEEDFSFKGAIDGGSQNETEELNSDNQKYNQTEFRENPKENISKDDIESSEENKEIDFKSNVVKKKHKSKKKKKGGILTLEEQKADLEARRKEKKYTEAEFKCHNCAVGFLFKDTYQAHMMRHEESNGEHQCPICTLRFANAAVWRAHVSRHGTRRGEAAEGAGPPGKRGEGVACHLCGNMFKDSYGLQQHLRRFHGPRAAFYCSVCGDSCVSRAALRSHMIKHINRKFACEQCPSTFSSPYTLAQHKKKHTAPPEIHYCEICHTSYGSRKSLLAHQRNTLVHQQVVIECPICTRICPNRRSLSIHMETHAGSVRGSNRGNGSRRPPPAVAVCHMCGARFKGKNKLNRHLREVCEKAKHEDQLASLYDQECLNEG